VKSTWSRMASRGDNLRQSLVSPLPRSIACCRGGNNGISAEMALRLSKALGRSPESWLAMQDNRDLWQARQTVNLDTVERIDFRAA